MGIIVNRKREKDGTFVKENPSKRFWRAVGVSGPDDCWPWLGACNHKGYGTFSIVSGNTTSTHRFAWREKNGNIPNGLIVCHKCDNPPCCNPSHLFLGTNKTNKDDSVLKRRHCFGERSPRAKLTGAEIKKIRELDKRGWVRLAIAKKFGISGRHVTGICRHESWRHID